MRVLIGTTMIALSVAGVLQAQEPEKRRAATPPPAPAPAKAAARPRVGTAATPTQPPVPVQVIRPTVYYTNDGYAGSGGQFLALSDGSVLVNFGNGYERVLRSCGQPVNAAQAERNATGRDALGRILPPPGIAALQAGSRGQILGNAPARNAQACFRHDGRGRTEVVTTGQ